VDNRLASALDRLAGRIGPGVRDLGFRIRLRDGNDDIDLTACDVAVSEP
jgi:hypothetical protein